MMPVEPVTLPSPWANPSQLLNFSPWYVEDIKQDLRGVYGGYEVINIQKELQQDCETLKQLLTVNLYCKIL